MQTLFKNTPLDAFTAKRQAEVKGVLGVINSHADWQLFANKAQCLADILPSLTKKHKFQCMPLFHGLDMLWALHRDGCDIEQEIMRHDGFLYDFHEADLTDSENVESPLMMLEKIGLQYVAFGLKGLTEEYRAEATIELADLLSARMQIFSKPMPQEYGITRLIKGPRRDVKKTIEPHAMDLLITDRRLDDNQKKHLSASIKIYLEQIMGMSVGLDVYHVVRDVVFRAYVYDYAVSMKAERLSAEDIIHNLGFVINNLLIQLGVPDQNFKAYRRCFLINACMPYSDLLKLIQATSRELSSGVSLPLVTSGNIADALGEHFSGIVFTNRYLQILEDIVKNLADDGYSVGFDEAVNNSNMSYASLSRLLKCANGYTPKVDELLNQDEMPNNHFRCIMKEVSLEKLSQNSINNLYFHVCQYHARVQALPMDNISANRLRKNMCTDACINYIKQINGFVGWGWKESSLPFLMEKKAITIDSCRILKLSSDDIKYLIDADPIVKRYLLSNDMGIGL